jgi:hypothetical protein
VQNTAKDGNNEKRNILLGSPEMILLNDHVL